VTFSWLAQGVEQAYFYRDGRHWGDYPVEPGGSRAAWPRESTAYHLTVVGPDGRLRTRSIAIEVEKGLGALWIDDFTVLPEHAIARGACAAIQWRVSDDVSGVSLRANGEALWVDAPLEAVYWHCPEEVGSVSYALVVRGPGGTTQLRHELDVVAPESPRLAEPTPGSLSPYIAAFSAWPREIRMGDCVQVIWQAAGSWARVRLSRGEQSILETEDPSGTVVDCPFAPGSVVYRITVSDEIGPRATDSVRVDVHP
jgi:hypothetical protein